MSSFGSVHMSSRRLSIKEQALWLLHRLAPGSGVSNEGMAFSVPGRLDHERLAWCLRNLVTRHPALRTIYPERDGEPVAVVLSEAEADLVVAELAGGPIPTELTNFVAKPFDITVDIPLRAKLWPTAEGDVVCLALHHLAYDARTAGVLFTELLAAYNGAEPRPIPEHTEQPSRPDALRYWREHVAGIDPAGQRMAVGQPDPPAPTFAGTVRRHALSTEARRAVATLAARHRCTENIVLLAAYYLLLARHGAGPDLVVGVSMDARDAADDSVGYHVNTLPMRRAVNLAATPEELIAATREMFLTGAVHRQVPYEAVLPDLAVAGGHWRTPLFRYMFNYRPIPLPPAAELGGLPVSVLGVDTGHSRQDLEFIVETGHGDGLINAVYSTEIFTEDDIRALQERYDVVLVALAGHGDRPLAEVDWWTERDRAVIAAANDTADDDATPLVGSAIIAADPDAVAMVDGEQPTSYRELIAAAAGVCDRLRQAGVRSGDVVALYAERGAALAAATLGVWAAGAAYLPLHPDHPAELLTFQLTDSAAAAVLTGTHLPEGVRPAIPVLPLDGTPGTTLTIRARGDDLAYLIYTSGSTGRPKGTQLTHDNLANLIRHFRDALAAGPDDAMLWLTTFAFDISALELFLPLTVGGRVVVAPDAARAEPTLALDLVERHQVRIVQATPTTWATVVPHAGRVLDGRQVLCGGEPLTAELAHALRATGCHLRNVYGPTETTIWSTAAELGDGPVTIGVPIRNTTVSVTDDAGTPLPPGHTGELRIAGRGVARGYRNLPELTKEQFGDGRYRTGDRARWRYDGTLELLGRTDRQVKVRGHRLELGEVEAALASHPEATACGVVAHPDLPENARLVAFVQPVSDADDPDDRIDRIWRHARQTLPSYALPARIVLGPLPTTAGGKVDYQALRRRPVTANPAAQPIPSEGEVAFLVQMWQELLADPDLGPDANFFLSGGHSLIAVRMLGQIAAATGVSLPLLALLDAPTPLALARHLEAAR